MAKTETAQAETSDPPSTSPQSSTLPPQNQEPTDIQPEATAQSEYTEIGTEVVIENSAGNHDIPTLNEKLNGQESQDDDVLFVFSVPRRRKKKRKRDDSFHEKSSISQPLADAPTPPVGLSPLPRKASANTAQKLQAEEDMLSGTKSGSLPAITPVESTDRSIGYPSFNALGSSNSTPTTPNFTSFPGWMPWWRNPAAPLLSRSDAQHNWVPIPIGRDLKHKWDGGFGGSSVCFAQKQYLWPPPPQSDLLPGISDLDAPGEIDPDSVGVSCTSKPQNPLGGSSSSSKTTSSLDCDSDATPGSSSSPDRASTARKMTINNEMWRSRPQSSQSPIPQPTPLQPYQYNNWQNMQIPASSVLDQSLSPRTKTVQILKPSQNSASSHQAILDPRSIPASLCHLSIVPSGIDRLNPAREPSFQHPRTSPTPLIPGPALVRHPLPQTNPFDILRKPSLYKIAPWSTPASPPHTMQTSSVTSESGRNRYLDITNRPANGSIQSSTPAKQPVPALNARPVHAKIPQDRGGTVIEVTPPPQPQSRPSSLTISQQGQRAPHKHPPNLIVDIAQICQENFPFADVAERHNVSVQKVFDTFSAIIQLPLLRHSTDNRRHGSLGKRRIKEFKDAKKAMIKANEEGQQKKLNEPNPGGSHSRDVDKPPRKKKKAPVLLKAAILNNVKEREAGAS